MKKEYIVTVRGILSLPFLKTRLSDEDKIGNVSCEVALSDKDIKLHKWDKVKVTIEKI